MKLVVLIIISIVFGTKVTNGEEGNTMQNGVFHREDVLLDFDADASVSNDSTSSKVPVVLNEKGSNERNENGETPNDATPSLRDLVVDERTPYDERLEYANVMRVSGEVRRKLFVAAGTCYDYGLNAAAAHDLVGTNAASCPVGLGGTAHVCYTQASDGRAWGAGCISNYGWSASGQQKYDLWRWDIVSGHFTRSITDGFVARLIPLLKSSCTSTATAVWLPPFVDTNINAVIWRGNSDTFFAQRNFAGALAGCVPEVRYYLIQSGTNTPLTPRAGAAWNMNGWATDNAFTFTGNFASSSNQRLVHLTVEMVAQCFSYTRPLIAAIDWTDETHNVACSLWPKIETGFSTMTVLSKFCGAGWYQKGSNCFACPVGTFSALPYQVLGAGGSEIVGDAKYPCQNCQCASCMTCPAGAVSNVQCTQRADVTKCYIGGNCFPSGPFPDADLGNCKRCNPGAGTYTAWEVDSCGTAVHEGKEKCRCNIGGTCYDPFQDDPANPLCRYCNPAVSTTSWTFKTNGCLAGSGVCGCKLPDGQCVEPGARPADGNLSPCKMCRPEISLYDFSFTTHGCLNGGKCGCDLSGVCVAWGDTPNDCQICDPNQQLDAYVFSKASACIAGNGGCGCQIGSECYAHSEVHRDSSLGRCLRCDIGNRYDDFTVFKGCYTGSACGCTLGADGSCLADGTNHPTYSKCQYCNFDASTTEWTRRAPTEGLCASDGIGDSEPCSFEDICQIDSAGDGAYKCLGQPYDCPIGACEIETDDPVCDGNGGCNKRINEGHVCRPYLDACTRAIVCDAVNPDCPDYIYETDAIAAGEIEFTGSDFFVHPRSLNRYTRSPTVEVALTDFQNTCSSAPRFTRLSYYEVDVGSAAACEDVPLGSFSFLTGSSSTYVQSASLPATLSGTVQTDIAPGDTFALRIDVRGVPPISGVTYQPGYGQVPDSIFAHDCTVPLVYDPTAPTWNPATRRAVDITATATTAPNEPTDATYICPATACQGFGAGSCQARATIHFLGVVEQESEILEYVASLWTVSELGSSPNGEVLSSGSAMDGATEIASETVEVSFASVIDVVYESATPLDDGTKMRICVIARNAVELDSDGQCTNGAYYTCSPPSDPLVELRSTAEGVDASSTYYYTGSFDPLLLQTTHGEASVAPIGLTRIKVYVDGTPGVDPPRQVNDYEPFTDLEDGDLDLALDTALLDGEEITVVMEEHNIIENDDIFSSHQSLVAIVDRSPPDTSGAASTPFDPRFSESASTHFTGADVYTNDVDHAALYIAGTEPSDAHSPPVWWRCALRRAGTSDPCGSLTEYVRCDPNGEGVFKWEIDSSVVPDGTRTQACLLASNQAALDALALISSQHLVYDTSPPVVGAVTVSSTVAEEGASFPWRIVDDVITAAWQSQDVHSGLLKTEIAVGEVSQIDSHLAWTELDAADQLFVDGFLLDTKLSHGGTYVFSVRVTNRALLPTTVTSDPFVVDLTDPDLCEAVDLHKVPIEYTAPGQRVGDTNWRRSDDWEEAQVRSARLSHVFVGLQVPADDLDDVSYTERVEITPFRCGGSHTTDAVGTTTVFEADLGRREYKAPTFAELADYNVDGGVEGYCVRINVVAASTRSTACVTDGFRLTPEKPTLGTLREAALAHSLGEHGFGNGVDLVTALPELDFQAEDASIAARMAVPTDVAGIRDVWVQLMTEVDQDDVGNMGPGSWRNWTAAVWMGIGDALPPSETALVTSSAVDGTRVELSRGSTLTGVRIWPPEALPSGRTFAVRIIVRNTALIQNEVISDGVVVLPNSLGSVPVVMAARDGPQIGARGTPDYVSTASLSERLGAVRFHPQNDIENVLPPVSIYWDAALWARRSDEPPVRFRVCIVPYSAIESEFPEGDHEGGTVSTSAADTACSHEDAVPWTSTGMNATTHLATTGIHLLSADQFTEALLQNPFVALVEGVGRVADTSRTILASATLFPDDTPPVLSVAKVGLVARPTSPQAGPFDVVLHGASFVDDASGVAACYITVGTTPNGTQVLQLSQLPSCPSEAGTVVFEDVAAHAVSGSTPIGDGSMLYVRVLAENGAGLVTEVRPGNNGGGQPIYVRTAPPLAASLPTVRGVTTLPRQPQVIPAVSTDAPVECTIPYFYTHGVDDVLCRTSVVTSDGVNRLPSNSPLNRTDPPLAYSTLGWVSCGIIPKEDETPDGSAIVDVATVHLPNMPFSAASLQCVVEACAGAGRILSDGSVASAAPTNPLSDGALCSFSASDPFIRDPRPPTRPKTVWDGPIAKERTDLVTPSGGVVRAFESLVEFGDVSPSEEDVGVTDLERYEAFVETASAWYADAETIEEITFGDARTGSGALVGEEDVGVAPFVAASWDVFESPPTASGISGAPVSAVDVVVFAVELETIPDAGNAPFVPSQDDRCQKRQQDGSSDGLGDWEVSVLRGVRAYWNNATVISRAEEAAEVFFATEIWKDSDSTVPEELEFDGGRISLLEVRGKDTRPWMTLPALATSVAHPSWPLPLLEATGSVAVVCVRGRTFAGSASSPRCSSGQALLDADPRPVNASVRPELIPATALWNVSSGSLPSPWIVASPYADLRDQGHGGSVLVKIPPLGPGLSGVARLLLSIGTSGPSAAQALPTVAIPPLSTVPRCADGGLDLLLADGSKANASVCIWTDINAGGITSGCSGEASHGLTIPSTGANLLIAGDALIVRTPTYLTATVTLETHGGGLYRSSSDPLLVVSVPEGFEGEEQTVREGAIRIVGAATDSTSGDKCTVPRSPGLVDLEWQPWNVRPSDLCFVRVVIEVVRGGEESLVKKTYRLEAPTSRIGLPADDAEGGLYLDTGFLLEADGSAFEGDDFDGVMRPRVRFEDADGMARWALTVVLTDEAQAAVDAQQALDDARAELANSNSSFAPDVGDLDALGAAVESALEAAESSLLPLLGSELKVSLDEASCAGHWTSRYASVPAVATPSSPDLAADALHSGALVRPLDAYKTRRSTLEQPAAWSSFEVDDFVSGDDEYVLPTCPATVLCFEGAASSLESCPLRGYVACLLREDTATTRAACRAAGIALPESDSPQAVPDPAPGVAVVALFPASLWEDSSENQCVSLVDAAVGMETLQEAFGGDDGDEWLDDPFASVMNWPYVQGARLVAVVAAVDDLGRSSTAASRALAACDASPPVVAVGPAIPPLMVAASLGSATPPGGDAPVDGPSPGELVTDHSFAWEALDRADLEALEDDELRTGREYARETLGDLVGAVRLGQGSLRGDAETREARLAASLLLSRPECAYEVVREAVNNRMGEFLADVLEKATRSFGAENATSDIARWLPLGAVPPLAVSDWTGAVSQSLPAEFADPETGLAGVALGWIDAGLSSPSDSNCPKIHYANLIQTTISPNASLPNPPPLRAAPLSRPFLRASATTSLENAGVPPSRAARTDAARRGLDVCTSGTSLYASFERDVPSRPLDGASLQVSLPVAAAVNADGLVTALFAAPVLRPGKDDVRPSFGADVRFGSSAPQDDEDSVSEDWSSRMVPSEPFLTDTKRPFVCEFPSAMAPLAGIVGYEVVLLRARPESELVFEREASVFLSRAGVPEEEVGVESSCANVQAKAWGGTAENVDAGMDGLVTGVKVSFGNEYDAKVVTWPAGSGKALAFVPFDLEKVEEGSYLRCAIRAFAADGSQSSWYGQHPLSVSDVPTQFDPTAPEMSVHLLQHVSWSVEQGFEEAFEDFDEAFDTPSLGDVASWGQVEEDDGGLVFGWGEEECVAPGEAIEVDLGACDPGSSLAWTQAMLIAIPEGSNVLDSILRGISKAAPEVLDGSMELDGLEMDFLGVGGDVRRMLILGDDGVIGEGDGAGLPEAVVVASVRVEPENDCERMERVVLGSRASVSRAANSLVGSHRLAILWSAKNGVGRVHSVVRTGPLLSVSVVQSAGEAWWELNGVEEREGVVVSEGAVVVAVAPEVGLEALGGEENCRNVSSVWIAKVRVFEAVTGEELATKHVTEASNGVRVELDELLSEVAALAHGTTLQVRVDFIDLRTGERQQVRLPLAVVDTEGPMIVSQPLGPSLNGSDFMVALVGPGSEVVIRWEGMFAAPFAEMEPIETGEGLGESTVESVTPNFTVNGTFDVGTALRVEDVVPLPLPGVPELRRRSLELTFTAAVARWNTNSAIECQAVSKTMSSEQRLLQLDADKYLEELVDSSSTIPQPQNIYSLPTNGTKTTLIVNDPSASCLVVVITASTASGRTAVLAPAAILFVDDEPNTKSIHAWDIGADAIPLADLQSLLGTPSDNTAPSAANVQGPQTEAAHQLVAQALLNPGTLASQVLIHQTSLGPAVATLSLPHLAHPSAVQESPDVDCQVSTTSLVAAWNSVSSARGPPRFQVAACVRRNPPTIPLPTLTTLFPCTHSAFTSSILPTWTEAGFSSIAAINNVTMSTSTTVSFGVRAVSQTNVILAETWTDGVYVAPSSRSCPSAWPSTQ